MAEDAVAPEFCQQTRDIFGDLIQKPPLTDKLLSRPPFRFLHDVVCAVIKQSGCLEGLYDSQELDAKVITEKEAKIKFLTKALDCIQFAIGEKLDVNPGKIVAGKEPEKTNEFLQKLAQAAKSTSPDASSEIVKRVLAGDKPTEDNLNFSGGSAGSNKENRTEKKPTEKKRSSSKEKSEKKSEKPDKKAEKSEKKSEKTEKTSDKTEKSPKHRSSSKEKKPSKDKDKKSSKKDKTDREKEKKRSNKPKEKGLEAPDRQKSSSSLKQEKNGPTISLTNGHAEKDMDSLNIQDSSPTRGISHSAVGGRSQEIEEPAAQRMVSSARPGTASRRPMSSMGRPGTSLGRPGTAAGRAPPRIKRKELGEIEQPQRLDSAGEQRETTNLIINQANVAESQGGDKDDEENFIVEEPVPSFADSLLAENEVREDHADADQLEAEEHGALVGRILQTKKQLEAGLDNDTIPERPLVVFDERERERIRKETTKIQESVQQLTRTAHPLGRLVDYLQEDVDSMVKELEQWRGEYKKNLTKLRQTHGTERTDLEPFRQKLNELEDQIREERDTLAAVRGNILTNESKLHGLVSSVAK